jgi:hypothetical protein
MIADSLLKRLRNADDARRTAILNDYFKNPSSLAEGAAVSDRDGPQNQSSQGNIEVDDSTGPLDETSLDEQGRICFYGSASYFHIEPQLDESSNGRRRPTLSNAAPASDTESPWAGSTLNLRDSAANVKLDSSTDSVFASVISSEITTELIEELLEVYWCWPHHLHRVLCRQIFTSEPICNPRTSLHRAYFAYRTSPFLAPLCHEISPQCRTLASSSIL